MKKVSSIIELTTFLNLFVTATQGNDINMEDIEDTVRAVIPEFLEKGMRIDWEHQKFLFHAPEEGDNIPLLGTIEWEIEAGGRESQSGDTVSEFKFIK